MQHVSSVVPLIFGVALSLLVPRELEVALGYGYLKGEEATVHPSPASQYGGVDNARWRISLGRTSSSAAVLSLTTHTHDTHERKGDIYGYIVLHALGNYSK